MESSDTTTVSSTTFHSFSPTSSSPPPPPLPPAPPAGAAAAHSPCAACKILRRRCTDKCVLAPYFPPSEPLKFATAHRVFGASNIIKLLQELPESQRADAVSSMVYEAGARARDPVYGCAGAICQLQKQADELQAQLARAHAELVNLRTQHKNLLALICTGSQSLHPAMATPPGSPNLCAFSHNPYDDATFLLDDAGHGSVWDDLTPLDV